MIKVTPEFLDLEGVDDAVLAEVIYSVESVEAREMNIGEWWELFQMVRKVRVATIRKWPDSITYHQAKDQFLSDLRDFDELMMAHAVFLGDRSTDGTDFSEHEQAMDDDGNHLMTQDYIVIPPNNLITTRDSFNLFNPWHWEGWVLDKTWMAFMGNPAPFDRNNIAMNNAWGKGMAITLAHLLMNITAWFEAVTDKGDLFLLDDASSWALKDQLKQVIHYLEVGAIGYHQQSHYAITLGAGHEAIFKNLCARLSLALPEPKEPELVEGEDFEDE